MNIRKIIPSDNKALADIIRQSLRDFDAAKPGTVYFDDTTDHLFELFQKERSAYFVLLNNGLIVGGAGIYPTEGLSEDTCELVKLYINAENRGKGMGKILMQKCEEEAKNQGFHKIYLETMPELNIAIPLYEKMGFKYIHQPLGNSNHNGCGIWMLKQL